MRFIILFWVSQRNAADFPVQFFLNFQGAAGAAVKYLGFTPGLFIVGLFAILILWMFANFWITGTLFVIGGISWLLSLCT